MDNLTAYVCDALERIVREGGPEDRPRDDWGPFRGETPQGQLRGRKRGGLRPGPQDPQTKIIADRLVRAAFAAGMVIDDLQVTDRSFGEGNTADAVLQLRVDSPYVLKAANDDKLAREANFLRSIQEHPRLPEATKRRFPKVYAAKLDEPPYAYLMEYFDGESYPSLKKHLIDGVGGGGVIDTRASRVINAVADALIQAWMATLDRRLRPSVEEDFIGRIRMRMNSSAEKDQLFGARPIHLVSEDRDLRPWTEYLKLIDQPKALDRLRAPFSTFVHGDPNPENILAKVTSQGVDIKFIDPKEWASGDWVFDVTKIAHYLEVTGPVEAAEAASIKECREEPSGVLVLDYDIPRTPVIDHAVEVLSARAMEFADGLDEHWRHRYNLGMAANLLGLPDSRLDKGREWRGPALVMYSEGVRWLDRTVRELELGFDA